MPPIPDFISEYAPVIDENKPVEVLPFRPHLPPPIMNPISKYKKL